MECWPINYVSSLSITGKEENGEVEEKVKRQRTEIKMEIKGK